MVFVSLSLSLSHKFLILVFLLLDVEREREEKERREKVAGHLLERERKETLSSTSLSLKSQHNSPIPHFLKTHHLHVHLTLKRNRPKKIKIIRSSIWSPHTIRIRRSSGFFLVSEKRKVFKISAAEDRVRLWWVPIRRRQAQEAPDLRMQRLPGGIPSDPSIQDLLSRNFQRVSQFSRHDGWSQHSCS